MLKNFLIILILATSFNCQNKKETKFNNNYSEIVSLIDKIENKNYEKNDIDSLYKLLKKNEIENVEIKFPKTEIDLKNLYSCLNKITIDSKKNIFNIKLIFELVFLIRSNVELSEHLYHLVPKLANINTKDFLVSYSELNNVNRDEISECLEFFESNEKFNLFLKNLNDIKDKNLLVYINELKEKMKN